MFLNRTYFLYLLVFAFLSCSSSQQFIYQRSAPHQIKHIAIQLPDTPPTVPALPGDYLQKMLAYMLFHEKPYFVQSLEKTNSRLSQLDLANTAPIELGRHLEVDGLMYFDFFDWIKEDSKVKGFTFSVSLLDLNQGKIVWQVVREFHGKEDNKSLVALKQYMQSKVKDKLNIPFFAEIYTIFKDAFQSLPAPNYTDEELTERLMSTDEPF